MSGEARIEIGGVARAHGIRGEVVIVTHDPDSETLGAVELIWIGGVEHAIASARDTQRGWLVQLAGITTRSQAEALRGQQVEVDRAALALDDGELLLHDLVGLAVCRVDGTQWGKVAEIMVGTHQDLLVVHDGEVERLLPIVDRFIVEIDVARGVVVVDPPDDLPEGKR